MRMKSIKQKVIKSYFVKHSLKKCVACKKNGDNRANTDREHIQRKLLTLIQKRNMKTVKTYLKHARRTK